MRHPLAKRPPWFVVALLPPVACLFSSCATSPSDDEKPGPPAAPGFSFRPSADKVDAYDFIEVAVLTLERAELRSQGFYIEIHGPWP